MRLFEGMIRRAREGDLDRVMEIEREEFPNPRSLSSFKARLNRDGFFVYEEEGEVVGYVVLAIEGSPWWMGTLEGGRQGHVLDLAVHRDHRRESIATELMRRVLDLLRERGVDKVKLEVRLDNEAAIELYESLGFVKDRVLYSYYANGDDAWLMWKTLD